MLSGTPSTNCAANGGAWKAAAPAAIKIDHDPDNLVLRRIIWGPAPV
jgi:hypothetical protein